MAHPIILRGTGHAGPKGSIEVEVTVELLHSLSYEEVGKEIARIRKLLDELYQGYGYGGGDGDYGGGH